jgi:ribosomal 50S subunit-recycling heat shock protein
MRLDLFLKWSRIIPRRTLAKEVCDAERVMVNNSRSRAGREIRIGDIVEIEFPRWRIKFRVRLIPSTAPAKAGAREMVEILEQHRSETDTT